MQTIATCDSLTLFVTLSTFKEGTGACTGTDWDMSTYKGLDAFKKHILCLLFFITFTHPVFMDIQKNHHVTLPFTSIILYIRLNRN